MADKRRGEAELIAHYFAPLASDKEAFGLRDDAAFLSPPAGYDLVVTKDLLMADVHFFANDPPRKIAQKALRVNLSDLAAKGAKPYGYLLGLGLPNDWKEDWLVDFVSGLGSDQKEYDFILLG
ncbi:MAG TPA: thiamine-phosphate kinase, partial [Rhizobiales bacterium]|nr:thiamine-phosphate kinase [Hyphomicrobiales bacterium]